MRWDTLHFLYHTVPGRIILKLLTRPFLSEIAGSFLDSSISKCLIKPFIKKNDIDMTQYIKEDYPSFNAFFSRQILPEKRPVLQEENAFMAPCDGYLTCIPIQKNQVIPVKQSAYTVDSLLRDKKLAKQYEDGYCLVFRLCVDHYHRYAYMDDAKILTRRKIKGLLHTVRPVALKSVSVFTENTREYMILKTKHFDKIIQMEVGAMLVGKIENYHDQGNVSRGQEKGRFLYGGSTIILLVKKDILALDPLFEQSMIDGIEIPVKMGERIGDNKKAVW